MERRIRNDGDGDSLTFETVANAVRSASPQNLGGAVFSVGVEGQRRRSSLQQLAHREQHLVTPRIGTIFRNVKRYVRTPPNNVENAATRRRMIRKSFSSRVPPNAG